MTADVGTAAICLDLAIGADLATATGVGALRCCGATGTAFGAGGLTTGALGCGAEETIFLGVTGFGAGVASGFRRGLGCIFAFGLTTLGVAGRGALSFGLVGCRLPEGSGLTGSGVFGFVFGLLGSGAACCCSLCSSATGCCFPEPSSEELLLQEKASAQLAAEPQLPALVKEHQPVVQVQKSPVSCLAPAESTARAELQKALLVLAPTFVRCPVQPALEILSVPASGPTLEASPQLQVEDPLLVCSDELQVSAGS